MFKKTVLAALLAAPLSALALPTTFSDVSLGGSNTVTFDQLQISGGGSTIVLTDSNFNGALDIGDTFVETGLIAGVGFTDTLGNPIPNTGLNVTGGYELWAVFDPLVGFVSGATFGSVGPLTVQTFTVNFTMPSRVSIFYDTGIGGGYNAGTSDLIGLATMPTASSFCTVTRVSGLGAPQETGSCVLEFQFDAAGVTAPGVWTRDGVDIGDLSGVNLRVDINVDRFSPAFFSPFYSEIGGTQVVNIDHNGSAQFLPEPGSLALVGLGLFGAAALRRRKQQA